MEEEIKKRIYMSNKSNFFSSKSSSAPTRFLSVGFFLVILFFANIRLSYYDQNSCSSLWLVFGVAKISLGISFRLEVFEGKVGAARLQKMCLDEGSSVAVCWVILSLAAGEEDLLLKYSPWLLKELQHTGFPLRGGRGSSAEYVALQTCCSAVNIEHTLHKSKMSLLCSFIFTSIT